jgi:DNA-binding IclR family transcriptional regulator
LIEEKIRKAIRENRDLTISKLAEAVKEPRAKVSVLVNLLAERGEVELIPVATGRVVRIKGR